VDKPADKSNLRAHGFAGPGRGRRHLAPRLRESRGEIGGFFDGDRGMLVVRSESRGEGDQRATILSFSLNFV
jgi:hypothetical protein